MYNTNEKKGSPRFLKALLSVVIVIAMVLGIVPQDWGVLTASAAATTPTIKLSLGTVENYNNGSKDVDSVSYSTLKYSSSDVSATLSGSTVTMKETSSNKDFRVGYVPIVASVDVPANTSYQTVMSFKISGSTGRSGGSGKSFVELFDLGAADKKSSLTFNTSTNEKASNSYSAARDDRVTNGFVGNYSTTVVFKNDTSSAKTVSYYFGLFVGSRKAATWKHQANVTCAITCGKLYSGSVAATIKANTSDARYHVAYLLKDSHKATQFLPDKGSITEDDWIKMESSPRAELEWRHRLKLMTGSNKLSFSKEKGDTQWGHMAYVPFTVNITVPANTARIFYLNFEVNYNRGTDSHAVRK